MIEIKPKSALEQPIYMLTKASTCPYLKDHVEKRIATDIKTIEKVILLPSFCFFAKVKSLIACCTLLKL